MYDGPFKKSPIAHNRRLFVTHVQSEALTRHQLPDHIKRKFAENIIPKFVGVCVH